MSIKKQLLYKTPNRHSAESGEKHPAAGSASLAAALQQFRCERAPQTYQAPRCPRSPRFHSRGWEGASLGCIG